MIALTHSPAYPSTWLAAAIAAYQRFLSPYKGFCCAHRALHRKRSCSEFIKQAILRRGALAGLWLARLRLAACSRAAKALRARRGTRAASAVAATALHAGRVEDQRKKDHRENGCDALECVPDVASSCDPTPGDCSGVDALPCDGGGVGACSCDIL